MEKFSDLDQMGFDIADHGTVEIRISKSRWDGETLISREYHRTLFTPDVNINEQLNAVNIDLEAMGFPALSDGDMIDITKTVERRRTPERIERFEAAKPAPPSFEVLLENELWRRIYMVMDDTERQAAIAFTQNKTMLHGVDLTKWPDADQEHQRSLMAKWAEIDRLQKQALKIAENPSTDPIETDKLWI